MSLPVKALFKLLRVLDVPREAVRAHLGATPSMLSMWATGTRQMPQRHVDRFLGLIQQRFDAESQKLLAELREAIATLEAEGDVQLQAYQLARERLIKDNKTHPWDARTPEERATFLRRIDEELPRDTPPLSGELRVEGLQAQLNHLFAQVERLIEEWRLEVNQPELFREVWGVCQGVAQYAKWEFEKFSELLHGPERRALLELFEQGVAGLRALDRLHAPPEVDSLAGHVERRKRHALQQAQDAR